MLGPRVERLGSAVVCVPVTGLDALAASVAEAFAGVGEPQPDRAFRGHLTLARLKGRRRCPLVGTEVSGTFVVSEVTLVRSRLDSAGARYEVLATRPLAH